MITKRVIEALDLVNDEFGSNFSSVFEYYRYNSYVNKIRSSFPVKSIDEVEGMDVFEFIDCIVRIYQMPLSVEFISMLMPFYLRLQENFFWFIDKFKKHIDPLYYRNPERVRTIVESFIFFIEREVNMTDIKEFIKELDGTDDQTALQSKSEIKFVFFCLQQFLETLNYYSPMTKLKWDSNIKIPVEQLSIMDKIVDKRIKNTRHNHQIAYTYKFILGKYLNELNTEEQVKFFELTTGRSGRAIYNIYAKDPTHYLDQPQQVEIEEECYFLKGVLEKIFKEASTKDSKKV